MWFFISYTTYCTQRLKKDSINFAVINLVGYWLPNQSVDNFCEIFKDGLEFSEILLEPYICILKRYLGGNLFIPCRGIAICGKFIARNLFFWRSIKMQYISYHQTTLFHLSTNNYDTVLKVIAQNKRFLSSFKGSIHFVWGKSGQCVCSLKIWTFWTLVFLLKSIPRGLFCSKPKNIAKN